MTLTTATIKKTNRNLYCRPAHNTQKKSQIGKGIERAPFEQLTSHSTYFLILTRGQKKNSSDNTNFKKTIQIERNEIYRECISRYDSAEILMKDILAIIGPRMSHNSSDRIYSTGSYQCVI